MVWMWDKISDGIIFLSMPAVMMYHALTENVFLNTAASDAQGLESIGDALLSPVQYVLNGKVAILENGEYVLEQRFDYSSLFPLKMGGSVFSLPLSLCLGSAVKGAAYLFEETRLRHKALAEAFTRGRTSSLRDYYQKIGLPVDVDGGTIDPPSHRRRPQDENVLKPEKELLSEIARIFKKAQIPFWVDCGTCIGAYRYGGAIPWDNDIDIAVLLPDFDNIWNVLQELDHEKYHVQDWSNRCRPKTYIRVYIKETRNHLDLYHFAINPEKKEVAYLLSNEVSPFMTESWKVRERRYTVPSAFETIFPLKRANFDGIEVFVPNQTKKYLQERYGENIEPAKIYDPETGEYEKDLTHPYWQIPGVNK